MPRARRTRKSTNVSEIILIVENFTDRSYGSTKQNDRTFRLRDGNGICLQISSTEPSQVPWTYETSAFGKSLPTLVRRADRAEALLSQKIYLSNGSLTLSASSGEPQRNLFVSRTRTNPGPEYRSMQTRTSHFRFMPVEKRVSYRETSRCLSSTQAPTWSS